MRCLQRDQRARQKDVTSELARVVSGGEWKSCEEAVGVYKVEAGCNRNEACRGKEKSVSVSWIGPSRRGGRSRGQVQVGAVGGASSSKHRADDCTASERVTDVEREREETGQRVKSEDGGSALRCAAARSGRKDRAESGSAQFKSVGFERCDMIEALRVATET